MEIRQKHVSILWKAEGLTGRDAGEGRGVVGAGGRGGRRPADVCARAPEEAGVAVEAVFRVYERRGRERERALWSRGIGGGRAEVVAGMRATIAQGRVVERDVGRSSGARGGETGIGQSGLERGMVRRQDEGVGPRGRRQVAAQGELARRKTPAGKEAERGTGKAGNESVLEARAVVAHLAKGGCEGQVVAAKRIRRDERGSRRGAGGGLGLLGLEGGFELLAVGGEGTGLLFGLFAGGMFGGLAGLAFGDFAGVGVGLLGGAALGIGGELLGGGLLADKFLFKLDAGLLGIADGLLGDLAGKLFRLLAGGPLRDELLAGGGIGVGALLSGKGGGGGLGGDALEFVGEAQAVLFGFLDL